MCSQMDDPTQYDAPIPSRPRKYELSGTGKAEMEPQPSIALAVIGDMLEEDERINRKYLTTTAWHWYDGRADALREARDRIAEAEG